MGVSMWDFPSQKQRVKPIRKKQVDISSLSASSSRNSLQRLSVYHPFHIITRRTLSVKEPSPLGTRILDAHRMKLVAKHRRTAEEHADIRLLMFLRQASKHAIPIRSTKVGRRTETSNRITFRTDVRDVNVVHVVFLELGGEVDANLDSVLCVLFLDCVEERMEPFCCAEITDHPDEVDFG